MLATVVIFVATYAGVALGRVPGLRIDRAGIALVGASLMIAFGTLSLEEAFKAIDLDAIALLGHDDHCRAIAGLGVFRTCH